MESNKHPVRYNSCNIGEILDIKVDIPLNPLYSPVLSVYVYDHVLGLIGTRLIGISHIPLGTVVKKTLKNFLIRRNRIRTNVQGTIEEAMKLENTLMHKLAKETLVEQMSVKQEAKLNKSLNKLQLMIDKGQVELESEITGGTEEHAIEDAFNDLEENKKEDENESSYGISDDEGEESEYYGSGSIPSSYEESKDSYNESTIRSNDIKISGYSDEEESEYSEPIQDIDEIKETKGRNSNRGSRRTSKRSLTKRTSTFRSLNKGEYNPGMRIRQINSSDEDSDTDSGGSDLNVRPANKLISQEGLKQGVHDKKHIERILSGYALRKGNIKKIAQQKIYQKVFKERAKQDAEEEEGKKEQLRKKNQEAFHNQEKRRKLKKKYNKKVSQAAEDTDPDEDLDMIPEYLKGRETYEDELEDRLIVKKPFFKGNIIKGQTRGKKGWFFKKVTNTQEVTGVFK